MPSSKLVEREKAITLRKQGYSYDEILKKVPVSISSLSLWLREIELSAEQKNRLREKVLVCHRKASIACRNYRIARTKEIKAAAKEEIGKLSKRDLWLIGIALYWAEGAKQKEHNVAEQTSFSNSDPEMVRFFQLWALTCLALEGDEIVYSLYIHENAKSRLQIVKKFWSDRLKITSEVIATYYKKHTMNPYRKNQGDQYMGVMRMRLRRSAEINRRITGWIQGICSDLI